MHFSLIQPRVQHEREAAYERTRGSAYEDHKWLWERFFPAPQGTPRDFVFRRLDGGVAARFYVVSARPPQNDVPGWEAKTKPEPYAPKVGVGERLHFELRANPVVSRRGVALVHADGSAKVRASGKHAGTPCHKITRHDVVMDAKKRLLAERGLTRWQDWNDADKPPAHEIAHQACAQWLVASGPERGFAADEASLSERRGLHPTPRQGREAAFQQCRFRGRTEGARCRQVCRRTDPGHRPRQSLRLRLAARAPRRLTFTAFSAPDGADHVHPHLRRT